MLIFWQITNLNDVKNVNKMTYQKYILLFKTKTANVILDAIKHK